MLIVKLSLLNIKQPRLQRYPSGSPQIKRLIKIIPINSNAPFVGLKSNTRRYPAFRISHAYTGYAGVTSHRLQLTYTIRIASPTCSLRRHPRTITPAFKKDLPSLHWSTRDDSFHNYLRCDSYTTLYKTTDFPQLFRMLAPSTHFARSVY